ncbi:MAG: hypothetical protein ACTSR8_11215 [Promethearchaeota archaeon]
MKCCSLKLRFHFAALINWLYSLNGSKFYRGKYHLFYQHNPIKTRQRIIHWDHFKFGKKILRI